MKNNKALLIGIITVLLVSVVGATFAYFVASGNVNSQSTVTVTTETPDTNGKLTTRSSSNTQSKKEISIAGTGTPSDPIIIN